MIQNDIFLVLLSTLCTVHNQKLRDITQHSPRTFPITLNLFSYGLYGYFFNGYKKKGISSFIALRVDKLGDY